MAPTRGCVALLVRRAVLPPPRPCLDALCLLTAPQTDLAIAEYRKAVQLQPGYVTAWWVGGERRGMEWRRRRIKQ